MFPVPLTFYYDFTQCSEAMYPIVMEEFARNGIKNLVLADNLIDILTRSPSAIGRVEKYANDAGITFCDAHGIFGVEWCLNAPNKRLRSAMLNQQRLAIDLCNYFNVKTITIHVGSMRPPRKSGHQQRGAFKEHQGVSCRTAPLCGKNGCDDLYRKYLAPYQSARSPAGDQKRVPHSFPGVLL